MSQLDTKAAPAIGDGARLAPSGADPHTEANAPRHCSVCGASARRHHLFSTDMRTFRILILATLIGCSGSSEPPRVGATFLVTDSTGHTATSATDNVLWFGPNEVLPDSLFQIELQAIVVRAQPAFFVSIILVGPEFNPAPPRRSYPIGVTPDQRVELYFVVGGFEWHADSGSIEVAALRDDFVGAEFFGRFISVGTAQPLRIKGYLVGPRSIPGRSALRDRAPMRAGRATTVD